VLWFSAPSKLLRTLCRLLTHTIPFSPPYDTFNDGKEHHVRLCPIWGMRIVFLLGLICLVIFLYALLLSLSSGRSGFNRGVFCGRCYGGEQRLLGGTKQTDYGHHTLLLLVDL
jgi:hypothetical protein